MLEDKKIPIDTVSFSFEMLKQTEKEITKAPKDGCYIKGLFLEGCRWDHKKGCLAESRPKELFVSMPIIWLKPVQHRKPVLTGIFKCPVYKVLTRRGTLSTTGHSTNFVMFVELPSEDEERKWVKAGVALFTALKY